MAIPATKAAVVIHPPSHAAARDRKRGYGGVGSATVQDSATGMGDSRNGALPPSDGQVERFALSISIGERLSGSGNN